MAESSLTYVPDSEGLVIEVSNESRRLIALSPAELRIRSVYHQINTFAVAFLGMFVPLLAMVFVPSECTPHQEAYIAATVLTGLLALGLFAYAYYGNWREEKARSSPSQPRGTISPTVMQ